MRCFSTIMTFVLTLIISPVYAYDTHQIVVTAQDALNRLGYDVGEADGQWGSKANKAMNALRERNGLQDASGLVGSSLALVHKMSPGASTLPHPGFFITDIPSRMAFLAEKKNQLLRSQQCPMNVGLSQGLDQVEVVPTITTTHGKNGYITSEQDWYSPILEGMIVAQDGCLIGKEASCQSIIDLAEHWAAGDALRPGANFGQPAFEDISWIGNILLRSTIISYGIARQSVGVSPQKEAMILDWMKRRVDDYHHLIEPSGRVKIDDPNNPSTNNHAMAHMMPAFVYGILIGDRTMTEPAIKQWQIVLSSMRKDGSFPTETRRGARWFQYTNIEIGQLVAMGELSAGQGIDLYGMAPSGEQTIPQAVSFALDALENFKLAVPYSKANVGSPSNDFTIPYFKEFHMGWLPAYVAHYGNDENIERMRTATIDPKLCSKKATAEHKTNEEVCQSFTGSSLSLAQSLAFMHMEPLSHMGYSAGCLQAQKVSVFVR